jgi:hypothetical protein
MTMDALAMPARDAATAGGTEDEADGEPRREGDGKSAADSSKEVSS